jgi:hypothetical protein
MPVPLKNSAPEPNLGSSRLMSLDALRGFDMFWIIGADALVYALDQMSPSPAIRWLARQLSSLPAKIQTRQFFIRVKY